MIRMISSILKALASPAKRSSAELKADLAKLDMQACEAKVTELERLRRQLLLRGSDEELRASSGDLEVANLEAERTQAAIDELRRLIADAEKREAGDALDAQRALALDAQFDTWRCFVDLDRHATEIARLIEQVETNGKLISETNKALGDAGRRDDRVGHPLTVLGERLELQHGGFPQISMWQLPGYLGSYRVEARYRLARAAEMLPGKAARKAA